MQSGGRGREGGGGGGLERERKKEVDEEGLEKEELHGGVLYIYRACHD